MLLSKFSDYKPCCKRIYMFLSRDFLIVTSAVLFKLVLMWLVLFVIILFNFGDQNPCWRWVHTFNKNIVILNWWCQQNLNWRSASYFTDLTVQIWWLKPFLKGKYNVFSKACDHTKMVPSVVSKLVLTWLVPLRDYFVQS